MQRWFVAAIVVVLSLAAGAGITQLRTNIANDRASQVASGGNTPAGSDDELVTRLLSSPFSPTGKEQRSVLVRGALPTDPKVDAPSPTGSRLIGSVVRTSGGTPTGVQVLFDEPGTPADITAFYERELGALGWKPQPDRGQAPSGFQAGTPGSSKTYCKGETTPWVTLTVFAKDKAPSDVRLNYQLTTEGSFGGGGPCSPQSFGPQPYPNRIPALRPPSDVQFRFGSGTSGSNNGQTSETNAITTRGASDLEAYFAGQLSTAGWTRVDGSASGPIAFSRWKVPGDGNWTGILLVIETGSDTRLLSVRAEAPLAR